MPKDNKSFDNLVLHYNNPLIKVQLHLFNDIVFIENGILVTFPTANPIVSFFSMEIARIMKSPMQLFIPKNIIMKRGSLRIKFKNMM